jgi:hypothetical protein
MTSSSMASSPAALTRAAIVVELEGSSAQLRTARHIDRLVRTLLGDFDKAEIWHQPNSPDGSALQLALVVKHSDDVSRTDVVSFSETEKELHHSFLGAIAMLSRFAWFSFSPVIGIEIVSAISTFPTRRIRSILDDFFPIAGCHLLDQRHEGRRDIVPVVS